ncbi:MSHA biogenesis protein MshN [Oceanisphaera litoralis]|uniref:tetratricopeptide repeat protein n=1 Tax=Oceanisphaera litoralis TaxID=225144 RepID=UPI00195A335B|nr:tetratricopeptide repeat protein [Oceanisphaera litoralis]MBM7454764.1 MSHA biogenesis protein MshN [Oceanisphaera litoralis]
MLLMLLPLSSAAQAQASDEEGWAQAEWPDHTAALPATESTLSISEVTLSRADWLADIGRQVDAALDAGDWARAEFRLARALTEYPDAHGARLRLASLQFGRGALEQARAQLQQGLELDPDQADLRLALARLLAEQQRYNAALQVLDDSRPPLPLHLDYYSLKADMARRSGQCEQAAATYRLLLAQSRVGAWWLGLGLCQRQLGEDFTSAFQRARASTDLGMASQRFVEQQLEQYGTAQTH